MKTVLLFMTVFCLSVGFAQTNTDSKGYVLLDEEKCDSILSLLETVISVNYDILNQSKDQQLQNNRYKLYSTENIYTLIQLDTKTGRMEQVQWSLDSETEGTFTINDFDLSNRYGSIPSCFELYPTKNMYQFILMDITDGRKWHVQWGIGEKKRWIRRIY